jgi:hypothetical protein
MCRVWLDNVAPAQQPAPTDCNSAVRNRPANARVLFGDDYAKDKEHDSADAGTQPVPGTTTAYAVVAAPTMASRWANGGTTALAPASVLRFRGERPHGPMADDAPPMSDEGVLAAWPAVDAAAGTPAPTQAPVVRPVARPVTRPIARPVARPATRRLTADARADDADRRAPRAADDWEAGYAAGYRDAVNGRRPRVRGVDGAVERGGSVDDGDGAAGPLIVAPSGADVDPRYLNNGRFPPPGRANGVCLDRDADGWCDDPRFGAPVCRDLDGDGRCDDYPALAAAPLPSTLPEMRAGADVRRGVGSATALRWLGTSEVIARVTESGRGGAPSRVVWLDANTGALLQVWTDRDGDGLADRVELYRGGRRVKLIGR